MNVALDTRQFDAALREYAGFVKKDAAYVVNRQSLNVMIKAMNASPVATREKIAKALGLAGMEQVQATRRTKSGKRVFTGRTKMVRKFKKPILYKLASSTQKGLSKYEIAKKASAIYGRRLGAIGYVRAGWAPAAKRFEALKLGLKAVSVGKVLKRFPKIRWSARTAKPGDIAGASFSHWIRARNKVSPGVLQKALNAAAVDMRDYIQKKFKESARKVSRIVR